ncbi:MAG TPA: GntR family transcriptional regulator [Chloroflexi bacterium]|nr:GntR family transcriptional regulator [Chloroflexota bacterium]
MSEKEKVFKELPHKSLSDAALSAIRKAILEGALKPGQRLVEAEIARQMGISRAPVREALRQLEKEGLISTEPHKGSYVIQLSADDLWEIYTLRAAIEGLGAELAALKATEEEIKQLEELVEAMRQSAQEGDLSRLVEQDLAFHECLCKASRHKRLFDIWLSMNAQIKLFINITDQFHLPAEDVVRRHEDVVKAIRERDGERAKRLISRDIIEVGREICAQA